MGREIASPFVGPWCSRATVRLTNAMHNHHHHHHPSMIHQSSRVVNKKKSILGHKNKNTRTLPQAYNVKQKNSQDLFAPDNKNESTRRTTDFSLCC
jgi:hypothetical protein